MSHEIGQWCVYPNLDEIKKYTGVLKAKNFEVFRETPVPLRSLFGSSGGRTKFPSRGWCRL